MTALFLFIATGYFGGHRLYIYERTYTLISVPLFLVATVCFFAAPRSVLFFRVFAVLVWTLLTASWIVDGYFYATFDFREWNYKQKPVTHYTKQVLLRQGRITAEQARTLRAFDRFYLLGVGKRADCDRYVVARQKQL